MYVSVCVFVCVFVPACVFRSSSLEMFSKKGAIQTRNKLSGEQPCRSVISTKPL